MKKTLSIVLALMLLLQSVFIGSINAQAKTKTYSSGNYQYIILSDKTVRITKYKGDTPESLTIPSKLSGRKVTSIGKNAFEYQNSLTELSLPNTLKSIGASAFFECRNLKSVTIPKSVVKLYGSCFRGCRALESVELHNGITSIGQRAFSETSIKEIKLPEKLTELSYALLKDCKMLESITIPNTVTSIGAGAFNGCKSLKEIVIPESVTAIGEYAFCDCDSLTQAVIPDSVKSIGECVFERCNRLKSVTLGKGINEIPVLAFIECRSLEELNIKGNVKSVGNMALKFTKLFEDESKRENGALYIDGILIDVWDNYSGELKIKEGTELIADFAFSSCEVEKIHFPSSVKRIGMAAFYKCLKLSEITVDKNSESFISEDGILYNRRKTALVCVPAGYNKTTSLKIPDTVKKISEYSCMFLRIIKRVELGRNVKTIEKYAFSYSESLKTVKLNSNLKKICSRAFYECNKLKSVTIPKNVKTIEDGALGMYEATEEGDPWAFRFFEIRGYGGTEAEKYCLRYADIDSDIYGYVTFVNLNIKAPKIKLKKGKNKMRVYRSKVKNADGYQISYTANGVTKTALIKGNKKTSRLIKNLKAGNYTVKIRAYKLSKQGKGYNVYIYGKWSKAKSITV